MKILAIICLSLVASNVNAHNDWIYPLVGGVIIGNSINNYNEYLYRERIRENLEYQQQLEYQRMQENRQRILQERICNRYLRYSDYENYDYFCR
jgi:hypothetical protein